MQVLASEHGHVQDECEEGGGAPLLSFDAPYTDLTIIDSCFCFRERCHCYYTVIGARDLMQPLRTAQNDKFGILL